MNTEKLAADGTPVDHAVGPAADRAAYDAWYAAATFETMGHEWTWAAWQAAVAVERERCARICEVGESAFIGKRAREIAGRLAAMIRRPNARVTGPQQAAQE